MSPLPGLPHTYRPFGARVVALVSAASLTVITVALWLAMPPDVRDDFTVIERAAVIGLLVAMLVGLFGIARTAVRADAKGLHIVNMYRRRDLDWAEVVAVSLSRGAPFAVIDTSDGGTISVLALQSADGDRSQRAVVEIQALADVHSGIG